VLPTALLLLSTACGAPPTETAAEGPGNASKGRALYATACTACHNVDPALPGAVGPEVRGASRELLEARLLRGAYPEGYAPKRDTALMPPMPQLEGGIDDLAAFLR